MQLTATPDNSASKSVKADRARKVRRLTEQLESELAAADPRRHRVQRLAFDLQVHRDGMRRHITRQLRARAGTEAAKVIAELLGLPVEEAPRAWSIAVACRVDRVAHSAREIGALLTRAEPIVARRGRLARLLTWFWWS